MSASRRIGPVIAIAYLGMALVTGVSRPKDCVAGSVVHAEPDRWGIVGAVATGVFWPVTLYRYRHNTGTVDGFLSRSGLCTPAPQAR